MKNLATKLVKVIGSVSGKVAKSGYNSHQKYNYVMESDLLDAVREEVVNHGLLITYSVEDVKREGEITTVKIKHLIVDTESGESLEVYSVGQGADKMDKGVYKAITGANKYFLLKTFMLSGNDDPEYDGVTTTKESYSKDTVTQNQVSTKTNSFVPQKTKTVTQPEKSSAVSNLITPPPKTKTHISKPTSLDSEEPDFL